MYALSSEDFSMDDSSTTMNLFKYISDNVINDLMMYRTSNVISSNTNSNSVKLQNQLQQQKNFLNSINLDNNTTSGSIVNSGVSGVGVTSTPTTLGGKTVATAAGAATIAVLNNNIQQSDDNMKTENVMITTVKVEPLNYTVSNSQPYNENMYTKRPRLESDEWMTNSSNNVNVGSQNNVIGGFATSPISNISYDGFNSPHGKVGIQDLSPSSMNGSSIDGKNTKTKKGPVPRQQEELCLVCGDRASGYHYNALTCEGCKGFFRRSVTKNAVYCCKFGHECEMDMYMRRKCQECRLKKCLAVGMRPECVVPENQCAIKRKEKKAQKEKDKIATGAPSSSTSQTTINNATTIIRPTNRIDNAFKNEVLPQLMKCDPPPHAVLQALLPEKLLLENKAKNIPQLTANQMAVIYKLIWYQDGYEQPSEEDLKRIMNGSEEEEDQCDLHFRHITEITILTVQLIVEFAKGLPAFTKIPQEDQITLLKACSSEVMMLRMARRYDASTDSILFANNRSYTRESYRMAGMAETIEDLLHFCRQMYSLTIDNVEYALLTAIVIFSDRPGLEKADLVEYIQEYYIETLKVYIMNRHGGDKKCNILFAKLLAVLTELRTLGNQNSEMCFSLKLKNKKLPRFLEEIWDVQDVPQNSTVTTNTTHIIQHAINDNSHNEEHMMH